MPLEHVFDKETKYYLINDFPGKHGLEDKFDIKYKLVSENPVDEK